MQKNEEKIIAVREKEKAVNHAEDIAQKAAAQYFGKEIMTWLEIPGEVYMCWRQSFWGKQIWKR